VFDSWNASADQPIIYAAIDSSQNDTGSLSINLQILNLRKDQSVNAIDVAEAPPIDLIVSAAEVAEVPGRSRKRMRNSDNWKHNQRKRACQSGESYTSSRGKLIAARIRKPLKCKCCYKCTSKMCDEELDRVCRAYWALGSKDRQTDYICTRVTLKDKRRNTKGRTETRRKKTYEYFLELDGERTQVCKTTFLATLCIGEKTVKVAKGKDDGFGHAASDGRGRGPPSTKKGEVACDRIKVHILSFPTMESHYTRANTTRKYLEASLNLKQMYRLYHQECIGDNVAPEKIAFYRKTFNEKFNLSFHKPKKDFCNYCAKYENMSVEERDAESETFESHHLRKEEVRCLKRDCKELAENDNNTHTVTFDLEQVLQSPKLNVGALFYKRKLSTYNLTVYSLGNKDCVNYMWHEGTGGRGSGEIASCVYKYLSDLPVNVRVVTLFSDSCGGQNRNINFSPMCLKAIQNSNLQTINQVFMESGHSQMECDSVHASIETACRNINIYSPTDYFRIVSVARRNNPYRVFEMKTEDFVDYKSMAQRYVSNRTKSIGGEQVNWLKIKRLKYKASTPNTIHFTYDYGVDFSQLCVNSSTRRGRRQSKFPDNIPLFVSPPAISQLKYNDLITLCDSLAIPRDYHSFYRSLNNNVSVRDYLPEPDQSEIIDNILD